MDETLEERLATVERALTDDDTDLSALAEANDVAERVDALEARVVEYDDRLAELEAATQALRGYVGSVKAVNDDVRQQAERALELAESGTDAAGDPADSGDRIAGVDQGGGDDRGADRREGRDAEPTLELEADESEVERVGGSAGGSRTHGDDGCPLCDGGGQGGSKSQLKSDRDTDGSGSRKADGLATEHDPVADARRGSRAARETTSGRGNGRTDGGRVDAGAGSSGTDPGLLSRVRKLL